MEQDLSYRNELKYILNRGDAAILRSRFSRAMQRDPHAGKDGAYHVRSLYLDNMHNKVLQEKIDGIDRRSKFRVRIYNHDLSRIMLEKKQKQGGVGRKFSAPLSVELVERLLEGDYAWMQNSGDAVVRECFIQMNLTRLFPKMIIDYRREAFICAAGNVRITFDNELRRSDHVKDFLKGAALETLPVLGSATVLEVKYDAFLPGHIAALLDFDNRQRQSVSKYALSRVYG